MRSNTTHVFLAAGFLFVLLISIGTISGAEIGKEYQITDAPGDQKYAYINENKIVWMDERTGDFNIHVYDLGPDGIFNTSDDGGERIIANKVGVNEYWPDIYGDLIPYMSSEFGVEESKKNRLNTSILLFNLKNNATADLVSPGDPYYQCCPQAYDITITWWDMRWGNSDVYLYDIGPDGIYGTEDDGGEFLVTAAEPDTNQGPPFIWGRNLVWTDYRNGKGDVYLYDAGPDGRFNTSDDRGEFRVTNLPVHQKVWDVRGHMIVWSDKRNWGGAKYDIYGYDMGPDGIFDTSDDRGEFRLTDENADQKYPVVYSNIIAWEDSRNGNSDLYIYDLGPDEIFNTSDDIGEIPLVTNPSNQKQIEIYDGKIVFDDDRTGDSNVYMYDLAAQTAAGDAIKSTPSPTTTTPAPSTARPKSEPTPPKGGICGPTLLVLLAMLPLLWRFYRPGEKPS